MYTNDNMLWIIARQQQQQFLKEAEASRVRRLLQKGKPKQAKLWQRVAWQMGGLLVSWGQRLQVNQEQKWA